MSTETTGYTCTATAALAARYAFCRFVMSSAAEPITVDLEWWSDDEIADLGWGVIYDHDDQGADTCETPEPVIMECECGSSFPEDHFNDHHCYVRAGEDHLARMMDDYD